MQIPARYVPAVEQAAFVIAIGLFAGAVLFYIRSAESAGATGRDYRLRGGICRCARAVVA